MPNVDIFISQLDPGNGRLETAIMDAVHLKALRCPECGKDFPPQGVLTGPESLEEGAIVCQKGHVWKVASGIPDLLHPALTAEDEKWVAEYDEMAPNYDEAVKVYDQFLGIDLAEERKSIAQIVPLEGPVVILDVSVGTGANFDALHIVYHKEIDRFQMHGLDVSTGMLSESKKKAEREGIGCALHMAVSSICPTVRTSSM